jgi:MOSC domain-containing protein YiiM
MFMGTLDRRTSALEVNMPVLFSFRINSQKVVQGATMFQGELLGIFVAAGQRSDIQARERIEAVPGRGLVGDRYYLGIGTFSAKKGPDREVTLIEAEALDGLAREYGITLKPGQARRNLLTRSVPLNHLVGQTFTIGGVVLRGLRLCEPCDHLEGLTSRGVMAGLVHRGGLRAQVIEGGTLEVGAKICLQGE